MGDSDCLLADAASDYSLFERAVVVEATGGLPGDWQSLKLREVSLHSTQKREAVLTGPASGCLKRRKAVFWLLNHPISIYSKTSIVLPGSPKCG